jgi:hypothetical protein
MGSSVLFDFAHHQMAVQAPTQPEAEIPKTPGQNRFGETKVFIFCLRHSD